MYRLKRNSIAAWQSLVPTKLPVRDQLRKIAPLRFWVSLLALLLIVVSLLIIIIVREDRLLSQTLTTMNTQKSWRKTLTSPAAVTSYVAVVITAGNAYLLNTAMKTSSTRSAFLARELAVPPPTWMERQFPALAAISPSDRHEMVLYAINALMVYQGFSVWRNWKLSPARAAVVKWQQSWVSKMLRNRELRKIQVRAARELASNVGRGGATTGLRQFKGRALKLISRRVSSLFKHPAAHPAAIESLF